MLKKLVQIVVVGRGMTVAAKAVRDQAQQEMYDSLLGRRYLGAVGVYKEAAQWLKDAEGALRHATVAAFDGVHKKPLPGLGIRVSKPKATLQINADPQTVRAWAINNAPSALMVDGGMLLVLAQKGLVPPRIAEVVLSEPRLTATIAKSLEAQ